MADTRGEAKGVYVISSHADVADGSRGLQLIDGRNPQSLEILDTCDLPGAARNVQGLASTVYVAGSGFGLGVFDVIDRSNLNPEGRFLVHPE